MMLLSTGCDSVSSTSKRYPDYRYRLTVEVETPEGLKTGSSVIEVSTQKASKFAIPNAGWVASRAKGEAVTVDLGNRGTMFALLRSEYSVDWANGGLMLVSGPLSYGERKAARLADQDPFDIWMQRTLALRGKHDIPRYVENYDTRRMAEQGQQKPSAYPIMVRFKDVANPKSVEIVDPDDLAASFGDDVRLKRITVEPTEVQVSSGIEKKLIWLKAVGQQRNTLIPNPPRYLKDTNILQLLALSDFSTELYK